jgi:tRNA (guanine-N7-)-methyltransferase
MGRRALRRIDPSLDLSRHLLVEDQLPERTDGSDFFPRSARLEVEIGSGKGLFLATASGRFPDRNFLGCEISRKYARFAAAKLARAGRENAVMVHGDALRLFHTTLATGCAAAVHVYFPDPWWKKRHRKRRVMTETFVADIARVLQGGGRLHFWSDVREYFDATVELITANPCFHDARDIAEARAEHDLDYRTHFERRMRQHGVPVYRIEFQRIS